MIIAGFLRIKFVEDIIVKLLNTLVPIVGNYGLAIIATTLIIKLITLPLIIKQEKSMLAMKQIQPKVEELKKLYGDDKMKLNEKTAELYKKENISPFGSCLPLIIQLPIFIALYTTFQGDSIPETASFLWFNLKSPDNLYMIAGYSINLLPILSTILMIVQQKMMAPATNTEDNQAQSAMMMMPVVMMFIFYNFPAGVNLYYLVNTLLSIIIQKLVSMKVGKSNE